MSPAETESNLRSRMVSAEHAIQGSVQRLSALEAWRTERDIERARHDERWRHMDEKIEQVGKKVDKISSDMSRVVWLLITGIIMAAVAFLVRGGFAP